MDFGFHPPTVYFPLVVPEALMIEPTETEAKETLDAFADAMLAIAREAAEEPGRDPVRAARPAGAAGSTRRAPSKQLVVRHRVRRRRDGARRPTARTQNSRPSVTSNESTANGAAGAERLLSTAGPANDSEFGWSDVAAIV